MSFDEIDIFLFEKFFSLKSDSKTILKMIKKITNSEKMVIALVSVVVLALLVNVLELACSSAFPAVFSEILAVNEITGLPRILYLLLYTFFYMIDDFVVFVIAVHREA